MSQELDALLDRALVDRALCRDERDRRAPSIAGLQAGRGTLGPA